MAGRTVLLDVDGVLFRNPRALNAVKQRIVKFVQQRVQARVPRNVTPIEATFITEHTYQRYGHTLHGLRDIYGKDDDLSLEAFNAFVYNESVVDMAVRTHTTDHPAGVSSFMRRCDAFGIRVGILSNAPKQWCDRIIENLDIQDSICKDMYFTSSHPIFTNDGQRLKPDTCLYVDVETQVKLAVGHDNDIIFIDDSIVNLMGVTSMKQWIPIYFKAFDNIDLNTPQSKASNQVYRKHMESGLRHQYLDF